MHRADISESTFDDAQQLARINEMQLTRPSDGCFQLRHLRHGWIINMYPRHNGGSPRMFHDPHHRGPFLDLPDPWTLLDAVRAAAAAYLVTEAVTKQEMRNDSR